MTAANGKSIFDTDKRIRLGIWGLGRGLSFYKACAALNIDVVAGCDFNEHMRVRFQEMNEDAFVTADAKEFLAHDFDAVLLATFCPNHADDAIACLQAGKHVLSEVTSFHTMAEGVRLVAAVEASDLVYNLAENYPFSAANMYLARRWREGLFGEFEYAEFEYVHEVLHLAYTYIDSVPVQPGHTVHNWRSWINVHYYNTHSLGPMMVITGERPVSVVSLPTAQTMPGYLMPETKGGICPSLIGMSNGAVVRNLMGSTTNDSHIQRIWGTLGSAEQVDGKLRLRLGGRGNSPKFEVEPRWDELGEEAQSMGHGGGDFWVLYYFARQIFTGEPAPFEIYNAADCTIPGILAYRSQAEGGKTYGVPDFRDPAAREQWRDDDYAQPRYDTEKGVFTDAQDPELAQQFSLTIRDLIWTSRSFRAYHEWARVLDDMKAPDEIRPVVEKALKDLPQLRQVAALAQRIMDHDPDSDGARVLGEVLGMVDMAKVGDPAYEQEMQAHLSRLPEAKSE